MVSIITVNYNGIDDTCEMIESFYLHEKYPFEIIIVDNGSRLPEGAEIASRYPKVKVVQNVNTGFAGGNNEGLKVAEGDFLFFLNNDTVIKQPILETLVRRLESEENGGVSPMIKFYDAPDYIQYAGFTPLSSILLRNTMIGQYEKDNGQYALPCNTAYMHGAAMMVRRDVIQNVGPMTEVFFLYYEEIDWSLRIKQANYQLWYEPGAVVYHKDGTGSQRNNSIREYYMSRARILFARRNQSGIYKLLSCLYLTCIAAPRKIFVHLWNKNQPLAKAVLRSVYDGLHTKL